MIDLQSVVPLLSHYGYFLLLPIAVVEGPIITVIAAFLASQGILNIYLVYLIAVSGNVIGDSLWYWVGRAGSSHVLGFVYKYGKKLKITESKVLQAEKLLNKHFKKTIVVGKVTDLLMVPIIIACGILKVDYKKFIISTASVDVLKDLIFTAIGFLFGQYFRTIDTTLNRIFVGLTGAVLVGAFLYFGTNYLRGYFASDSEN